MDSIVSDTTALIVLARQQRIAILGACFERILLPPTVYEEWLRGDARVEDLMAQHRFLRVVASPRGDVLEELQALLDPGEAEAIALAKELRIPLLVDEKKGRTIARMMGIPVVGLVGVLCLAVESGVCSAAEVKAVVHKAVDSGFRLSNPLYAAFVERVDEIEGARHQR
ncbi:MAG: hypothetical protein U5S82_11890 [Gammaproteobacteria bacterium]|nr:hypothetical protein [Gammaproteobacteria bacterium]